MPGVAASSAAASSPSQRLGRRRSPSPRAASCSSAAPESSAGRPARASSASSLRVIGAPRSARPRAPRRRALRSSRSSSSSPSSTPRSSSSLVCSRTFLAAVSSATRARYSSSARAPRRPLRLVRPCPCRLFRAGLTPAPSRGSSDEAGQRLAVAAQRGDRDPLLGAVVAVAGRARTRPPGRPTRGRRPRRRRRRGRRSSPARGGAGTRGLAESPHEGRVRVDHRRRAGGRWRAPGVSGRSPTCSRIASGSCSGRKRMSTSMTQVSGTLFRASPPRIRPRLIEGRSNRAELCAQTVATRCP